MFCQNMTEIAIELAAHDASYERPRLQVCRALPVDWRRHEQGGQDGMWDEADGFYYDVLRLPDGSAHRLKVRSLVGLLPIGATTVIESLQREQVPGLDRALQMRFKHIPELRRGIHPAGPEHMNAEGRTIAAVVDASGCGGSCRACWTKRSF